MLFGKLYHWETVDGALQLLPGVDEDLLPKIGLEVKPTEDT